MHRHTKHLIWLGIVTVIDIIAWAVFIAFILAIVWMVVKVLSIATQGA